MTSRRWSGAWARPLTGETPELEVLIPTAGRSGELAVTLAGLAAQDDPAFNVIISDQSADNPTVEIPAVAAMIRVLRAQGRVVRTLRNLPRRGMAQQRQFLLESSNAQNVLFLDDDVWCEPGLLARLSAALNDLNCGFVGSAVQGLSFLGDERPDEQEPFEVWREDVKPESIRPGQANYARASLHNAANLTHVAAKLRVTVGSWVPYKIAWIGGCVLFRRQALLDCGGFDFWPDLPPEHSGEDVVAQWRVMERFGGAGILPSGAVHLESPTTVKDRRVDAPDVVCLTAPTHPRHREK